MSAAAGVVTCRPLPDYGLWLRFEDGLQGEVYLGNLLEIGVFRAWQDQRLFMTARPDHESHSIVWAQAGIRLDCSILWHHLLSGETPDGVSELAPPYARRCASCGAPSDIVGELRCPRTPCGLRPGDDESFRRFMLRALERGAGWRRP